MVSKITRSWISFLYSFQLNNIMQQIEFRGRLWTHLSFSNFNRSISSVQLLSRVWLFVTPWTAARQASLSFTNSQSLLKLTCINSVMPSNHLILLLSLSSPAFNLSQHWFFPVSQLFASGGQSIGASKSASVLPMNIQDWFPLGLTGLISLQSKGLSRVFSNSTVQKHQFFSAQFSLWSNFHMRTWPLGKPKIWPDGWYTLEV